MTRPSAPPPHAHFILQPCDEACAFAARLRAIEFEDWLWCSHPANDRRIVRRGAECRRFRPREMRPE